MVYHHIVGEQRTMAVDEIRVHMIAGDGETSYTNNSAPQKIGISKALHVLDEALRDMAINDHSKCFKIADLGCSSGPNTLSVVSHIIDKIQQLSNKDQICPDEFQVFLNDLPGNDFNNLFKLLPDFYKKLNHHGTKCFVSGLPGSFYGRLFPSKSLDFVYSSYGLHWLSQLPQGLEDNRGNIHLSKTSPPEVFEAYREQYCRDLSTFLSSRGEEMAPGGRMVLTLLTRNAEDPSLEDAYRVKMDLMANTLGDMVAEGLIKEADLHSYNIPIYPPSRKEVEGVVSSEGSFSVDRLDEFALSWDVDVEGGGAEVDEYKRVELSLNFIRATSEPMMAAHFVGVDMDEVFERYRKKLTDLQRQSREVPPMPNMVISLTKK